MRGVCHVRLSTRDAMAFYRRLGFCELAEAPRYPWTSTEMIAVCRRAAVSCSERPPQPMP
jgi:ribosomal protein S18 acetylase RimI-like enzyme